MRAAYGKGGFKLLTRTPAERIYQLFNYLFLTGLGILTVYPFIYVLFASVSEPSKLVFSTGLLLYPKGFTLKAYEMVFKNPSIYVGYANTLFYVVMGTAVNIFMTTLGAYVLSREGLLLRKGIMLMFVFTMYFNGGLIPNYMLIKSLHMDNTRWALIIPVAISTWNLIIMTTSFKSVPKPMIESAKMDGAGEWRVLCQVVVPLSIPLIMVIVLYYSVGHWNSWFNAMIYLRKREMFPLQLFLREILVKSQLSEMTAASGGNEVEDVGVTIKHATVIVSALPILLVYPYVQKHFVKGIMIGAIKE